VRRDGNGNGNGDNNIGKINDMVQDKEKETKGKVGGTRGLTRHRIDATGMAPHRCATGNRKSHFGSEKCRILNESIEIHIEFTSRKGKVDLF
jgi:hypothetical protein